MEIDREVLEEKEDLKQSFMTEEEIREADRFLLYYQKAHRDKANRNLFKKWEEIEQYWEGELDDVIDENDPGSNTNIVNSNVER